MQLDQMKPYVQIKYVQNHIDIVNSSPPVFVYLRRWIGSTLVQIMACRLFGAKPLSNPMLSYCQLDNKLQWNFNQNTKLFIHKNENIFCEMMAWWPFCPGEMSFNHRLEWISDSMRAPPWRMDTPEHTLCGFYMHIRHTINSKWLLSRQVR